MGSQTYSRTLDELFGFGAPAPRRRNPNGAGTLLANATAVPGLNRVRPPGDLGDVGLRQTLATAYADRPTTRHGRSSESSASSNNTNKTETLSDKFSAEQNKVDVWTREEDRNYGSADPVELLHALGSKRRSSRPTAQSPILEHELSEVSSEPSTSASDDADAVKPFHAELNRSLRSADSSKPTTSDSNDQVIPLPSSSTSKSSSSQSTYSKAEDLQKALNTIESRPITAADDDTRNNNTVTLLKPDTYGAVSPVVSPSTLSNAVNDKPPTPAPRKTVEKLQRSTPKVQSTPIDRASSIDGKGSRRGSTGSPKQTTTKPSPNAIFSRLSRETKSSSARHRAFGSKPPATMSMRQRTASTPPKATVESVLSNNSESYNLWLKRKFEEDKRKKLEEKQKKEAEEQAKKEQKENSEKAFKRWQEEHEERRLQELRRKKKLAEEAKRKAEQEKEERKKTAEKTFETWKTQQEEKRRQERIRKAQVERQRSQSAAEAKKKQQAESEKAYRLWSEQMVQRQRETEQMRLEEGLSLKRRAEEEKMLKDALADEAFDLWLEMKRKEAMFTNSLAYKILDYDHEAKKRWPTPWIPSGNTVPRKFLGTGNRRRTIERPLNIVQQRAKSVY